VDTLLVCIGSHSLQNKHHAFVLIHGTPSVGGPHCSCILINISEIQVLFILREQDLKFHLIKPIAPYIHAYRGLQFINLDNWQSYWFEIWSLWVPTWLNNKFQVCIILFAYTSNFTETDICTEDLFYQSSNSFFPRKVLISRHNYYKDIQKWYQPDTYTSLGVTNFINKNNR